MIGLFFSPAREVLSPRFMGRFTAAQRKVAVKQGVREGGGGGGREIMEGERAEEREKARSTIQEAKCEGNFLESGRGPEINCGR